MPSPALERIHRRAKQISQYVFVEECARLSITATQFDVLWVLGQGVQLDQISIARLLGLTRAPGMNGGPLPRLLRRFCRSPRRKASVR
jgi:hypothetical protein